MRFSILVVLLIAGLSGCGDTQDPVGDCETDIAGCTAGQFSCPEADNCYGSERLCEDSGECD